jgi:predicted dithiol-disulfide oxidoreductase (DUF899 family)
VADRFEHDPERVEPEGVPAQGIDLLSPVWHLLELTPQGRGEWYAGLDY